MVGRVQWIFDCRGVTSAIAWAFRKRKSTFGPRWSSARLMRASMNPQRNPTKKKTKKSKPMPGCLIQR